MQTLSPQPRAKLPLENNPHPDRDDGIPARVTPQALGCLVVGLVRLSITVAALLLAASGAWAANRLSRSLGRVRPTQEAH
jgi:hypothetical protein